MIQVALYCVPRPTHTYVPWHPFDQMLIVCLAGVGASVTAGSAAAHSLVSTTFCVQLLVFLWITCLCPSVDRVDNVAVALGWGLSIELHMGMTYVMDHVVYRLPILHKKITHSSAPPPRQRLQRLGRLFPLAAVPRYRIRCLTPLGMQSTLCAYACLPRATPPPRT